MTIWLENLNLDSIREQILAYSVQLTHSYWEIGRRLHYAKQSLLSEDGFLPWIETLYIDYPEANRMMYIAKNLPNMKCYEHLGLSLLYLIATIPEEHRQKIYTLPSGQRKYLHQMSQLELRTVKRLLKAGQLESCFREDNQQGEKETQDAVASEASQARALQSSATNQATTQQGPTSPQADGLQSDTQSNIATHQASQSQTNLLTPSQDLTPNPLAPKLAEAEATNQRLRESLKQANAKYQEDLQSIEERYRYLKRFREGLSHFANRSTTFIPDLEGLNRIIAFSHEIDQRLGDKDALLIARRPQLVRLVYRTARLAFLSHFSLSSYGHLPQERYESAVSFWKEWQVPADLQAQLDQAYKDLAQDRPQLHAVA